MHCNHPELSLPGAGTPFSVLLLKKSTIPTLDTDQVTYLLAICSLFVDIDTDLYKAANAGKNLKASVNTLEDTLSLLRPSFMRFIEEKVPLATRVQPPSNLTTLEEEEEKTEPAA